MCDFLTPSHHPLYVFPVKQTTISSFFTHLTTIRMNFVDKNSLFFSPVPPASTSGQGIGLSQSAGAVSLHQAFSELRQNQSQFEPGPSTAPASMHSTHPPLLPPAASVPSQTSTVAGTAPCADIAVSNLNQALEQVPGASLPPRSSSSPPSTCLSPPYSSSPPSTVVNQSILMSQVLSQPGIQAVSQPQGQGQAQIQPQVQATGPAVNATSVPSTGVPPTRLTSPPATLTASLVCSPPSTVPASEVPPDHPSVSPASSTSSHSSFVTTTATPGPQLASSAACHPSPPSSFAVGLQPATANVPSVQPTLVHTQPQTAALPGQTHTHCAECDAR